MTPYNHTLVQLTEVTYQRSSFVQRIAVNTETLILTTNVQRIDVCIVLGPQKDIGVTHTHARPGKHCRRACKDWNGEDWDERVFSGQSRTSMK